MSHLNRIIVTGTSGAGKSTFINALSHIKPVVSDIYKYAPDKQEESRLLDVQIDYGEYLFDEGRKLELYALPGQKRFSFLWQTIARRATGMIILVDNRRPDPMQDLAMYLENFEHMILPHSTIIGVNYADFVGGTENSEYLEFLFQKNKRIPVLPINARSKKDAQYLLQTLLYGMLS